VDEAPCSILEDAKVCQVCLNPQVSLVQVEREESDMYDLRPMTLSFLIFRGLSLQADFPALPLCKGLSL
jgi:hypothetical protein